MKLSRNDPCPCGSGKKYKACCMTVHQTRERIANVVGVEEFAAAEVERRRLVRANPIWEADVVPLLLTARDAPDGMSLVMVTGAGFVLSTRILPFRPVGPVERARAIAEALPPAELDMGALPERLHVRDDRIAEALAGPLGARGVAVAAAELDDLDEALDAAIERLAESPFTVRMTTPMTWRETEASPPELEAFHRAAAGFYSAAPWEVADEEGPLLLQFPDGSTWVGSTMGAGGMEYGLMLYEELDDLLDVLSFGSPEDIYQNMRGAALTADFDQRRELTPAMRREVAAAGWPIAGPKAFPRIFGAHLPERRVLAHHVRTLTAALAAVACVAREEDPEPATGVRVSIIPLAEP